MAKPKTAQLKIKTSPVSKVFKSPLFTLGIIALLAYGLLASQLGFYWDDLAIGWIRYQLGREALTDYFSTNRPALGILYQSLTTLLPYKPLFWQLLALSLRWLSSLLLWAILRQLFPQKRMLALTAALLFLLYPAFNQQFVSFVYSSHFTALILFLFSIYAMLRGWTALALLASALNFLLGEYFFLLDLIRYPIYWLYFHPQDEKRTPRAWILAWVPYLGIFFAAIIGRAYIIPNQTYQYSFLNNLKAAPLAAVWTLAKTIFHSLGITLISAWGQAFKLPDFELQGKVTISIYIFIISIISSLLLSSYLKNNEKNPPAKDAFTLIALGIFAALLAGAPFWLTGLPVSLGFPANRATLPFMLGSVFFLVGIISLIPRQNMQYFLFALIIAFSTGRQFLWADEFRRDWTVHRNLFWQMSWRIPDMEEGTLVLLNEGALKFYADNSLSAPLNWIYAPDTDAEDIPYMLFYPRTRFGAEGEKFAENLPVEHNFIAGKFTGNTNQMLILNFSPPGCLHVIDPDIDVNNKFIADLLLRDAAPYSRPALILTEGEPPILPDLYATEPSRSWCYYYQQADLARQRGDWETVIRLNDEAFALSDHPNDPTEYFPFIEAYAHLGDWENAKQASIHARRVSPSYMDPLLCPLWQRIEAATPDSPEKADVLLNLYDKFNCE